MTTIAAPADVVQSQATALAARLVEQLGVELAHRAMDAVLANFSTIELAALAAHWPFWARPKQLAPRSAWRSWGFLAGRGFGKTAAIVAHITEEVQEGRATNIGLCAQKEEKTIEMARALEAGAPPWFKPHLEVSANLLVWPNGAKAFVRTPEAPDAIRSENHELAWLSEMQSWPKATRDEAYSNFMFATRIGYARTVWDATAKRGHPILKKWIERAARDPDKHVIVRGSTHENAVNLGDGVIEDLVTEFDGTRQGREELYGDMGEEGEGGLFDGTWIERNRRARPDTIVFRVLSIDPAVTSKRSSDMSGMVEVGRGVDGQALVLGDYSGKHRAEVWGGIAVEKCLRNAVDLVVIETNKGGELTTQNLRAAATKRGIQVVVIGKDDRVPFRQDGIIYVREVYSRGPKEDRAQPVATAYEANRVSHVRGVDLTELELVLTTWEPAPGAPSPDRLDALVGGVKEVLGIRHNELDPKAGFAGILKVADALKKAPRATSTGLSALLRGTRSKI